MKTGVYFIRNRYDKNIFYLGKAVDIDARIREHYDLSIPSIDWIDDKIAEFGPEDYEWKILAECSEEQLDNTYEYWYDLLFDIGNGLVDDALEEHFFGKGEGFISREID